jgi:glycolate oxidase iron-sulfur subunit
VVKTELPDPNEPLGSVMPDGSRFIGREPGASPAWPFQDHPAEADLDACVACGLCLPHCPTYRLTGEESASPRGRIAAMRAVSDGVAGVDDTFGSFMDLCLVCRACEDVCPSHVPFGRMMEAARVQVEPLRSRRHRFLRWLGLDVALPRKKVLWIAAALQPLVSPLLSQRIRAITPPPTALFRRLPSMTDPPAGTSTRGTVAVLSGCVQDRWFRDVNESTIRVLSRSGWRVTVPRSQACCGALAAHNGHLRTARTLARRNARVFAGVDHVVVNAAGCSAHMKDYPDLVEGTGLPVADLMEFLAEHGIERLAAGRADRGASGIGGARSEGEADTDADADADAYHDACHALRAQGIMQQPRDLLSRVPGIVLTEIRDPDRCCGAAGLYNVTEPELAGSLMRQKAEAIRDSAATVVASANPGCTMQIRAGLRELGHAATVVHPVQLLDAAMDAAIGVDG